MTTVRIIYHHESDGWWAEAPDVEGWSAAGASCAEVVELAEEGVPFALGRSAELEHYVPAGEHAPSDVTIMGHAKIQTTFDVYGHLLPGSHDEVRERMDLYLRGG